MVLVAKAASPRGTTRDRLTEAAIALFQEAGYDATSVNDIVARAGVTKGAFYHCFRSKIDCLRELHAAFVDGELSRLEQCVQNVDGPEQAIRNVLNAFLYGVKHHQGLQRIFDQEWRQVETEGFEEIRLRRDRILEIVVEQVRDGISTGIFKDDLNPQIVALGIVGMSGWAHRWFRSGGPMTYEQIADTWASAILGGILKPEPSA